MAVALAANALTTLQTVKDDLDILYATTTWDDFLTRKINVASQLIEDHCGRVFGTGTVVETFAAEGQLKFVVARKPITSITSIVYDGTTVEADNYETEDAAAGVIRMLYGTADVSLMAANITGDRLADTARKLYTVTYVGGYVLPKAGASTLPATVEEACVLQVVSGYRQRGRDKAVTAERLLSWSASYAAPSASSSDHGLIPEVAAMLTTYVRIIV